ncbi:MAG: DUF167 domain-containing protein [Methanobacteriota archaeon]
MLVSKAGGVLLAVRVTPRASKDGLSLNPGESFLRVRIKAPARDGKANRMLVGFLHGIFGECEIVQGFKSANKVVFIKNASIREVEDKINLLIKK